MYRCEKCEEECFPVELNVGNYEEFWGQMVWRDEWETVSSCCHAELMKEKEDAQSNL